MDVALLKMLEDRSPTPPVVATGEMRRLRQLWLAGMPLARAAVSVRVTFPEAEEWLTEVALPVAAQRKRVDVELLRRLYVDEGLPVADIAERLGCSEGLVRSRVSHAGLRRVRTDHSARVVRLYRRGWSIRAIAQKVGVHHRSVWRILDGAGVARRPVGSRGRRLRRADLQRLYVREGLSLAEVARRLDVNVDAVKRNLDRLGIPRRGTVPLDPNLLARLDLREGRSIRAMAARLRVSAERVRRELVEAGIPIRRPAGPAV